MKILIAEDDMDMAKIIELYLRKEGYETRISSNGKDAFELLEKEKFDLAVIDWMMPVMDGLELTSLIKEYHIPVRTVMLTARDLPVHEVKALKAGADDYIRKPFEPEVLLLRIKKILHLEELLTCKELTMNVESSLVEKAGVQIKLSKKEYELLKMLMINKGIILSRQQLLNNVWGMDYQGDDRTVDTHIRRLRTKIGEEYIVTTIGLGYHMEDNNE